MLLTAQQGRVCKEKSPALMRGRDVQKQTVFKASQLFDHTVRSHVNSRRYTLLALCVFAGLCNIREKNSIPPIALGVFKLFRMSFCQLPIAQTLDSISIKEKMFYQCQMFLRVGVIPFINQHDQSYKRLPVARSQDTPFY